MAPLLRCSLQFAYLAIAAAKSFIPALYYVKLHDNTTLGTHWESLGLNLSQTGTNFSHYQHLHGYKIRLRENSLHELVNSDPGVKYVVPAMRPPPHMSPNTGSAVRDDLPPESRNHSSQFPRIRRWEYGRQAIEWPQRMVNAGTKLDLSTGGGFGLGESVRMFLCSLGKEE
ncbi:MAG: hypothetical protein Q9227_009411 [Pyrenula ochraceoflavens]